MDTRQAIHFTQAETLDTEGLRAHFLIERVFQPGAVTATLTHYDRMVIMGIAPEGAPLSIGGDIAKVVGVADFFERRELGAINIGAGAAIVTANGESFTVAPQEAIYIGMGARDVTFASQDPAKPAKLYATSAPAHATHPTRRITVAEATPQHLGEVETANKRTIFKYIHPDGAKSCQLVMGLTRLEAGSVWNTMPAHTHDRRMEAYLYFELPEDRVVFHLMGRPEQTRHMVIRNEQAIISPPWSIHAGAGTGAYAFIWAMAGDNQSFADMDFIPMGALK